MIKTKLLANLNQDLLLLVILNKPDIRLWTWRLLKALLQNSVSHPGMFISESLVWNNIYRWTLLQLVIWAIPPPSINTNLRQQQGFVTEMFALMESSQINFSAVMCGSRSELPRGWRERSHICEAFCNSLFSSSPNCNYRHKIYLLRPFLYVYLCLTTIACFCYRIKWRLPLCGWETHHF